MARSKSGEQGRGKSKAAIAVEELTRGVEKFHVLLAQLEDLSREGFPYRDAVRAKTELQIRDTIKRVFGDKSPEYQTYKTHKLRMNTPGETTQSVALLKGLITSIENRKLDLLGIRPTVPPTPAASSPTQPAQAPPQLSLVPPAASPAQVTITPAEGAATPLTPSPVTMSVSLTTNLGIPPTPPTSITSQIPSIPKSSRTGAATQAITPTPAAIHIPITTPPAPVAPPLQVEQVLPQRPPLSPPIAPPIQTAQPERTAQISPAALTSTQPVPVLSSTATRASSPATTSSLASTPTLVPSSQSGAERPAGSIASSPATAAENVAPSALPTRSRARSSMRLSSPPGIESRPQAPGASTARGTFKGDPSPSKPRNEAAVQRARSDEDPLEQVRKLCSRFHGVVRQMRLRREYRATLEVEDEYDVQDLLHALLRLEFDEVEVEDWTPTYTQGANRTTFLLAKNTIALVVKKTRPGLGGREIAEELKVDAERYAAHKDCGTLFCFVYDPEARIGNPRGFEADLTSICDTYTVQVLVAPK